MTIYSIPFRSVENHLYEVLILDKSVEVPNLSTQDIVRLTPSDSPFTLDWDASEDPFLTRRRCTGNISFLTDNPNILKSIHPFTYTDYPVIVSREGTPFFYGFLAPDAFDAPFDSRFHEVTLNVVDILTAWDAMDIHNYDTEGVIRVSLQELIATAIEDTMPLFAQHPNQTVPMDIFLPHQLRDLFTQYVSTEWLKEYQTGDGGMPNDAQQKSIGEVVDAILLSAGCQMVQEGKQIMVLCYPFTDSITTIDGQQTITPDNFTPSYRGTQHTASIFPGAKRLEINARFDYEKPKIMLPEYKYNRESKSMGCYVMAVQKLLNGNPLNPSKPENILYMERMAELTKPEQLPYEINLYFRKFTDTITDGKIVDGYSEYATFEDLTKNSLVNPIFRQVGKILDYQTNDVKTDCYNFPDTGTYIREFYSGAFLCQFNETYPDYPEKDIHLTGLLVENIPHNVVVCTIESQRKYYFEPGAYIRFSFDALTFVLLAEGTVSSIYHTATFLQRFDQAQVNFRFRMMIGNYYVDAWEANNNMGKTFYCERDVNGNFIYNKTDKELKAMNFSGNGYYIRVPHGGYQSIRLEIWTDSASYNTAKYYFFNGVRIDYMGLPNQFEGANEDEYTRKTILNARLSEIVNLQTELSCRTNNRRIHFDNELTDSEGIPLSNFNLQDNDGNQTSTTIFDHLEDRYRRFYEKARYKLSLQTTIPFNTLFRAYMSNTLSYRFMLIAKSDDYRQEQSTITLLDTTPKVSINN